MLIVLEGVDGSGKSTLVDALLRAHGKTREGYILHSGPIREDPMIEYEHRLKNYDRMDRESLTICDRWHVGELVYGPLYRGRSRLTQGGAQHVEMYLQSRGALNLVVYESVPETLKRLKERGDRSFQFGHLGLVWDFYQEYARNTPGWRAVRSTNANPRDILRQARLLQAANTHLARFKTYVGPPSPTTLVVCAQRAAVMFGPRYESAYAPWFGNHRAEAVMSALHGSQSTGVMAICEGDSIREAYTALRQPRVVAMDTDALAACKIAHVPVRPGTLRWLNEELEHEE